MREKKKKLEAPSIIFWSGIWWYCESLFAQTIWIFSKFARSCLFCKFTDVIFSFIATCITVQPLSVPSDKKTKRQKYKKTKRQKDKKDSSSMKTTDTSSAGLKRHDISSTQQTFMNIAETPISQFWVVKNCDVYLFRKRPHLPRGLRCFIIRRKLKNLRTKRTICALEWIWKNFVSQSFSFAWC